LGQVLALLYVLADHFNITNPGELSWLAAGYSLTCGTFILISGRLGDLFGYKKMMIIGYAWFSLWSVVAGLSTYSNHVLFIFARVFQGIGPAILMPNAIAIFGSTYAPGRRKGMVFSLFGACAPGGGITGAAFAGLFSLAWWPWTLFAFAIGLAVLAVLTWLVVPDPPRKSKQDLSLREKLLELDIPGGFTGVTALVLINFAWNQAPIVGWQKAYVYICLTIGLLFIPIFFFVELRVSRSPLIPFDALSGEVGLVLACLVCGWASFGIWYLYSWEIFFKLRDASPLLATAWFSPVVISGVVASIATGAILLPKLGPPTVMMISLVAFTTGTILMMTVPVNQIYWAQTFISIVIMPFGMDMSFPAATLILSDAVKKEHQGIAASLVSTIVNYSISLGLGFAGTVEVHKNNGGHTKEDLLKGYRAALYMAVGLSGTGIIISALFLFKQRLQKRRQQTEI
jgi:MFS family permease